jgi:hypothetical protein
MKRELMKIGDERGWCLLVSKRKKHSQYKWLGLDL